MRSVVVADFEKQRAREIYNSYKSTRSDPGLLEQTDYRTFEMRVFPIGPKAEQTMNVCLTDDQKLLRQTVREFAEAELRPHVMEWDEAQAFPRELLDQLAELGLMGIQFPEHYGGSAMSAVDYCICIEELARVDPSLCLSVAAHNGLGSAHIFMFGSEEQKQRYLPRIA